ncbi:MAG: carbon storage regulator, partial [Ktedonobacteraceae bacterium]|nr:carbon storage regulator [Ktedonobacteraceae bacterium]
AITVSILAVEGERVKLGIDAPPDVTIVREELTQHEQTQHRRSLDGWNEQNIPAEH